MTTPRTEPVPLWNIANILTMVRCAMVPVLVVLGCAAVAAASLAIPASPAYDVWAWLVWGREVTHLDLATTSAAHQAELVERLRTLGATPAARACNAWARALQVRSQQAFELRHLCAAAARQSRRRRTTSGSTPCAWRPIR